MVRIKKKGVGEKTSISENIEHVDSTGKSKLGQDSDRTKEIMTNSPGSTTSTSTVVSQNKLSSSRLIII